MASKKQLNCPNCGAPITSSTCPYCGSIFYDFVSLDCDKPTYVRVKWYNQIVTARVLLKNISLHCEADALPDIVVDLTAVPDENGICFEQEEARNNGSES